MQSCMTCGMPFEGNHVNDIGLQTTDGPVCMYDVTDGVLKTGPEIFQGGVAFFLDAAANGDRELAERLTRKNMNMLPYWQAHHFAELDGTMASDEEFAQCMAKL